MPHNGDTVGFTPTQSRILYVLRDGLPHTKEDLLECIASPEPSIDNLRMQISLLRKKLNARGQDIKSVLHKGKPHYCHVILLAPTDE